MSDDVFWALRSKIQEDIGQRGLARLFAHFPGDFEMACRSLAQPAAPQVVIVTGFYIATAGLPETDGPFGSLLLAEAIVTAGGRALLVSEPWLQHPFELAQPERGVELQYLRPEDESDLRSISKRAPTHLIAIERPGPSWADQRYRSMMAIDLTPFHHPTHRWFEAGNRDFVTIGIGDGGNEIGMGKVPAQTIAEDVIKGDQTACRTPTDLLIVAGISNWGAYALAAGFLHLRNAALIRSIFDEGWHRQRWQRAINRNLLVDGRTGVPALAVDGQPWEAYIRRFREIREVAASG